MKKILFILCFLSVKAYAQEPTYVPMKSNYLFRGIKMDSLFIAPVYPDTPTATTKVNFAGSVVRVGSKLYMRNPTLTQWIDLSSQGSSFDTTSLSNRINGKADTSALALKLNRSDSTIYYTKYMSDTSRSNIYSAIGSKMAYSDTVSLSNRINNKIDSLRRVGTQISFKKNGTWYNAYTDSVGAGQNGRWGNDTATIVLAKVRNSTLTTMARGTVVMLKGATGDVASVIRANNKSDTTSSRTIGLVKDPINAGDTGWVITQGQASKLNLGAFNEGDVLYLDSLDGGLTNVKPHAPYHQVFVGIVERANNGNGLLYTKPQNGYELDEIHDVKITNPINNQLLVYSDTQDLWENKSLNSILYSTSPISLLPESSDKLNIFIDSSTTLTDGYLTSYKFNQFNNKLDGVDTLNLSNRIDSKADTSSLGLKLNIADTSSMLMSYLKESDTSALSNRIDNFASNTIFYLNLFGGSFKSKLLWSDYLNAIGTLTLGSQQQFFAPFYLNKADTIKGITYYQRVTGNFVSNNYNGVALYSYNNGTVTLIDTTANSTNTWKATANSWNNLNFVNKVYCQPGIYYVALLYSSSSQTTAPQVQATGSMGGTNYTLNPNLNGYKLFGIIGSRTTPIASQALSGLSVSINNPFFLIY